jgi:hypothetical protein
VARKRKPFDLTPLNVVSEDLRVPSLALDPPRLQGHAFRFTIVLPLLSQTGEVVYTSDHLRRLVEALDRRCGGILASSSLSHPTWYGSYVPEPGAEPVKDYHTILYIYTRQTDAADRFFQLLKTILKTAGLQEQEEILVERTPVWLVEAVPLPRPGRTR